MYNINHCQYYTTDAFGVHRQISLVYDSPGLKPPEKKNESPQPVMAKEPRGKAGRGVASGKTPHVVPLNVLTVPSALIS